MSKKVFNIITVMILVFFVIFLPLKMAQYNSEIDYADKQMQEDTLPGQK